MRNSTMESGDESSNVVLSGWSWEDNKLFELALASVDEENPDRWEEVASMVGGKKSAEEVKRHYEVLLEDLEFIESGRFDHEYCVLLDETTLEEQAPCRDGDQELLAQLTIN